ncbi:MULTISPECIES: heme ABC exporter ATP-binding protein CcmA [Rhizobium]|uniref:Heme ABC exporter ATP-binding protein CcmA n=1 Tax=Rhizobium tropici TaxID=398 RepID=A0A6P1C1N4_RHITR|nr:MULTISPECIES: heme ABC exporter ATP-binding protein CcmA [Rhizobium]AGB72782.1 heme ABC exporter, ATP-binding protein CcmA [Rhizobium tropici CIAT 899]MBB4241077.1 heme exporter protein A [Rhizobium tropici]MBB5592376.1 heme exporter protein A [Rhizobium tropici]MBB6491402.1 heme exporter protein A [Rhizobium tropici]NEV10547.1 heme ABC exporter ATP-binding protein CcmA [Rhizobium tropici]
MHLSAENLAARRGEDLIFLNVSFDLAGGDALVLTGRNGSGKSTLLRVVAGLLRPEKGRVAFTGKDGELDRPAGEASHYLGHRNAMKSELTVAENLTFWKTFFGDMPGGSGLDINEAVDAVGLADITHLPFGYLSAGQQRRIAFAKLLVAHRPIWILDEPTAALDSSADRLFAELITAHQKKGGIVLAATHQPLGLENAQEMRMTGFVGASEGVWG